MSTFLIAIAVLVGSLLLIRLGGQFVAGHALRITERYRNKGKSR